MEEMEKYFDVNAKGNSIHAKIYAKDIHKIDQVILFGHGFGGHKDNNAAARFAEVCSSKYKTTALITFDWPCHGNDARNKITLDACESYVQTMLEYIEKQYAPKRLVGYATSFGGYQFLRYIHRNGNPFAKLVLRCPAVNMYYVTMHIMSENEKAKLEKGKDVLTGFDRKVKINKAYVEELKAEDITEWDFLDFADDLLIIHGTEDEIVPYDVVAEFAENNVIEFVPMEGVDHRFRNPLKMDAANNMMMKFLEL